LKLIFTNKYVAYTFEQTNTGFKFKPKKATKVTIDSEEIDIKAFKLYRERKEKLYMTPLIFIENKK